MKQQLFCLAVDFDERSELPLRFCQSDIKEEH